MAKDYNITSLYILYNNKPWAFIPIHIKKHKTQDIANKTSKLPTIDHELVMQNEILL